MPVEPGGDRRGGVPAGRADRRELPDGTRVLVAAGEFTSVSWPFAAQAGAGRHGGRVRARELGERAGEFDVVAVSVVQSADGRIVDLDALRAAQASGTRVVLDATQALGWLAADLGWADAVVGARLQVAAPPAGRRGWPCAPDLELVPHHGGLVRRGGPVEERLRPAAAAGPDGPRRSTRRRRGTATSARPRRCRGSPGWTARRCARTASGSPTRSAPASGCRPRDRRSWRSDRPAPGSGSPRPGWSASVRAGAVRLAFHLYNTDADVDRVLDALAWLSDVARHVGDQGRPGKTGTAGGSPTTVRQRAQRAGPCR